MCALPQVLRVCSCRVATVSTHVSVSHSSTMCVLLLAGRKLHRHVRWTECIPVKLPWQGNGCTFSTLNALCRARSEDSYVISKAKVHLFNSIMFFCVSANTFTMSCGNWTSGRLVPFELPPAIWERHICVNKWRSCQPGKLGEYAESPSGIRGRGLRT